MTTTPPAITISQLSKSFGTGRQKTQVVKTLSLSIPQGEVFGFLGPNGAGKSTTIKLLLNFLRPDQGTLEVAGRTVGKEEYRNLIGYCSEFPFFYDHLTARETLRLSGRLSGTERKELHNRIETMLTKMNLHDAANQRIGGFSKGMKQRLGMANALIHDPPILIFDEPMSGLDPLGRHLIKNLITELREQGKTVFFSSHILSDIEELCDRIGVIHRGTLLFTGLLTDFMAGAQNLEECFVNVIEEADRERTA